MLWDMAARGLRLGVNVILDFGFWAISEREDYRARTEQLDAGSEMHFLDVPDAMLLECLEVRNAQLPHGVPYIPEASLKAAIAFFQRPTPFELELRG